MSPWSRRGCGREGAESPGNGTASPRRVHGRDGDTGGQGFPQLEAGTPQTWPWGDAQNGPLGWACAHAHSYAVPGPGKGHEPRATAATSSTGSRVRAEPRPRWVGAAPCPRSGCAPGRTQALRPPPGLRPRGPTARSPARACRPHAGLPPRRASFPLPGSGDGSPGAKNRRHLAPPPEAARAPRAELEFSRAGRRGPREREEKPGERREFKGARERDKEKGGGCALRPSSLLGWDRRPWPLWGPCAGPPLSSLVSRFRGTCVSLVLGLTFNGAGFPACCEIRG